MQRCCACYTKRLLTHHDTCWNVTKCHAKHAKLHCDLLRHHGKGKVLQLPPIDAATASTEFVRHPRNLYFVTTSRSPANAIRLKCCACHAQATWTQPKYCACHTKRLSTRYETCCNVTNWHACHEGRGYTTFEASKRDDFCKTRHTHGHSGFIADGCGHFHQTPKVKREPFATHSGKNLKT